MDEAVLNTGGEGAGGARTWGTRLQQKEKKKTCMSTSNATIQNTIFSNA